MANSFITFALAEDGQSIWVFEDDELTSVIDVKREDRDFQLSEYLRLATEEALAGHKPKLRKLMTGVDPFSG